MSALRNPTFRRSQNGCGRTQGFSRPQRAEKCFRVPQVARVEAFSEPGVEGREQIVGVGAPPLIAPKRSEARGGAKFPGPSLLGAGNFERAF